MPSAGKRTVNRKSFNFLIVTKIMLSNLKKYQLILASNSPRRKELMSGLGVEYVVRTLPDVDESYPETLVGAAIPEYISRKKAGDVKKTFARPKPDSNVYISTWERLTDFSRPTSSKWSTPSYRGV